MTTRCVRCQVLEVPAEADWTPPGGGCARELLPWADPYIATLVRKLEGNFDFAADDEWLNDPFGTEETVVEERESDWPADEWLTDAFMPAPAEAARFAWIPPMFGGFPLLDDE